MSKELTAREFIPKKESGKYSRNEVETYSEEYAKVKIDDISCLLSISKAKIEQLQKENERFKVGLDNIQNGLTELDSFSYEYNNGGLKKEIQELLLNTQP